MARMRLRFNPWPRPAIELTDTPRPKCPDCDGAGGWAEDYADDEGEFGGTDYWYCTCWDPSRVRRLLTFPRWTARLLLGWTPPVYSSEPPF
ncbi:hypothetical protein [Kitasatospora sp. NPDC057500]|uniref:hypothetical protein n=1 Tax=Kitasatospora sp. NPDC057500 TaxID=3346151 RepID=UPI0036C4422F